MQKHTLIFSQYEINYLKNRILKTHVRKKIFVGIF